VFGGVIPAGLPVIVGSLSIDGSLGIMRLIAAFGPVHYFAQPVVTMIGLGIAIDYGLFVVSRFREETAAGYDTETAVRRTVMIAGRTVSFSAVIIVASAAGLLNWLAGRWPNVPVVLPNRLWNPQCVRGRIVHARGGHVVQWGNVPAWCGGHGFGHRT
jgi:predicted RND superfamily exporter protein